MLNKVRRYGAAAVALVVTAIVGGAPTAAAAPSCVAIHTPATYGRITNNCQGNDSYAAWIRYRNHASGVPYTAQGPYRSYMLSSSTPTVYGTITARDALRAE